MNVSITQQRTLLLRYLRPLRWRVASLTALLLGSIALQLLNPQVIRYFIDTTQAEGAVGRVGATLVVAALLFMLLGIAQRAVSLATIYVGENVAWSATNSLRADLLRHSLGLDMSFHKQRTPGELIARIDGDVTELTNFFSQLVIRVAGNVLLVAGVLMLLFREDWRAGLALSVYAVVTLLALGAIQNLATARFAAQRQAWAAQFGFIEERISGTEDVRASGAEAYVLRRLHLLMRDLARKHIGAEMVGSLSYVLTNFLFAMGYALGLALGAYLYSKGDVTIGAAFLIVYYIGMLAAPLENIREQFQDLQQASASIGRVGEIFDLRPRVEQSGQAALPTGALRVEFREVSFEYDDNLPAAVAVEEPTMTDAVNGDTSPADEADERVLRNVDFDLAPGKVFGLLGRTGSGKTTLTRLIFRLYDPTAGSIRLNGVDLRDIAPADLRGRIGMVTQDVQLFQATIRDNLAFFNPAITDRRIEEALGALGLWEWIGSLPRGLDTELGANGQGLSAGEAQLLAFTRVFLKDPGLVILDEASSRLDPATERLLERAVDRLLAGRTAIIIAHRLRTVQRADEIMIMEQGRIVERGARPALHEDPSSRWSRLLQTGIEEALA